jgi:hypothetical protein
VLGQNADDCETATNVPQGHRIKDYVGIIKFPRLDVFYLAFNQVIYGAMAGQAETERERRAKIINAEGEFQAAEKLVQAAAMISGRPIALQLRYLQTMKEISSEHNTTTFLPIPMDLFAPFLKPSPTSPTPTAP